MSYPSTVLVEELNWLNWCGSKFLNRVCVCVCTLVNACEHGAHAKARGQLAGVGSLLLLCGYQVSNSGHQAWGQVPLLTELFH